MTVQELKDKLNNMPNNADVCLINILNKDVCGSYVPIYDVEYENGSVILYHIEHYAHLEEYARSLTAL